ncbi:hypothetical protein GCM10008967_02650 [Bacillus carboniphilus]|uniref:MBL fold metallo-hydrolase n=1 Tax=Bacillus carboniphilus TaxID=86663 RepID=A0ABP3FE08_9BACI
MKITWVNHASFILEKDDIRIISDPWIEGKVFDNGWSLLAKSKFTYEDYKDITHIWFSHEHPDHFFPPNIKNIPEEYRKNITILFQNTRDRKVVDFCSKMGFKEIIELNNYQEFRVGNDLTITISQFGHDSWICYKSSDTTILNINDCEFSTKEQVREVAKAVGKVDVLLTQFSFAGYPGNEESAKIKRERLKMQAEVTKPRFLIPFASFVWFCHEENYHMNKAVNKIGDMYTYIKEETAAEPIIMYPGDEWKLFEEHDSFSAIQRYNEDYKKVEENPELVRTEPVDVNVIRETFHKFTKGVKEKNNLLLVKALLVKEPTTVHVTDHQKAYKIDVLKDIFEEVNTDYDHCDVALSSEALNFCFKFSWGWDTLNINGRFQSTKYGDVNKFRSIGGNQLRNSHGEYITIPYLLEKAKARAWRKVKGLN